MLTILVIQASMLSSCYHNTGRSKTKTVATAQPDTAAFERTHHYSLNYNFVVKADSLVLLRQQPEELLNGMHTTLYPSTSTTISSLPTSELCHLQLLILYGYK